jgi:hypothetical protein
LSNEILPCRGEGSHFSHPVLTVRGSYVGRIESFGDIFDFEQDAKEFWDAIDPAS